VTAFAKGQVKVKYRSAQILCKHVSKVKKDGQELPVE
jgi:hypothetical protein